MWPCGVKRPFGPRLWAPILRKKVVLCWFLGLGSRSQLVTKYPVTLLDLFLRGAGRMGKVWVLLSSLI